MKKSNKSIMPKSKEKTIIISTLFITSILISISGVFFTVFSIANNIHLKVLNTTVPGAVFGVLVLYLGIRYFLMVQKLKPELMKPTSSFSWNNFKKQKTIKNR